MGDNMVNTTAVSGDGDARNDGAKEVESEVRNYFLPESGRSVKASSATEAAEIVTKETDDDKKGEGK